MSDRTHIRVTKSTREKLGILRDEVMIKENVNDVIVCLMQSRSYTDEFFKQIREKVSE